jgi:hypothetical protein
MGRIAEDDRSANARQFADALYNEREREQRKPLRRAGRGRLATAHELLDESYSAEEFLLRLAAYAAVSPPATTIYNTVLAYLYLRCGGR